MSINWYRVYDKLNLHYPIAPQDDIDTLLRYLYVDKHLTLIEITKLTDGEVLNQDTIARKLKSLGVKINPRGGLTHSKPIPLTIDEFKKSSARELSRQYDVHINTIYYKKHKLEKTK